MNFASQRAGFLSKPEALSTNRRPRITPPSQPIENTARKRAFYSRAPKVEVYEDKGQSAILLAARTHVFPLSLPPLTCNLPPAGPNRHTPRDSGALTPRKQTIGPPPNPNTLARVLHPFPSRTFNRQLSATPRPSLQPSTLGHSPRPAPRAHRTPAGITPIPWPSARPQPINYKLIARGKSRTP